MKVAIILGNRMNDDRSLSKFMIERLEFAKIVSKANSINQQGNKNSQFGTKWYTNRNTGETKKFKEKPVEDFWIEGRNLFHGEFDSIKTHLYARNKETRLINAKKLWNDFHSGNYNSIREFAKEKQISKDLIMALFKLSPFYKELFKCHYWVNSSNKNYISENGILYNYAKTMMIQCPAKTTLTSIELPSTIENINTYGFSSCKNIQSVILPLSLKTIGEKAFQYCQNVIIQSTYK